MTTWITDLKNTLEALEGGAAARLRDLAQQGPPHPADAEDARQLLDCWHQLFPHHDTVLRGEATRKKAHDAADTLNGTVRDLGTVLAQVLVAAFQSAEARQAVPVLTLADFPATAGQAEPLLRLGKRQAALYRALPPGHWLRQQLAETECPRLYGRAAVILGPLGQRWYLLDDVLRLTRAEAAAQAEQLRQAQQPPAWTPPPPPDHGAEIAQLRQRVAELEEAQQRSPAGAADGTIN